MNNFCPPPLPANTHWIVSCFGLQPVTYASCGLEPPRVPAAIDSEQGPSCLQVDSVVHLFRSWPFLLMSRVSKAGVKDIVHVQAAAALPMRRQSLTIYLSTNSKRLPRRARPPSEAGVGPVHWVQTERPAGLSRPMLPGRGPEVSWENPHASCQPRCRGWFTRGPWSQGGAHRCAWRIRGVQRRPRWAPLQ